MFSLANFLCSPDYHPIHTEWRKEGKRGETSMYFVLAIYKGLCPFPPVLLPGKSHGRRSLIGCSPWGHQESGTTERLPFHFSLSCIGEGNGNPLQCSCLENPRDGGAWWGSVYGVAQSRTRLKWLSSSNSLNKAQKDRKRLSIIKRLDDKRDSTVLYLT